MEKLILLLPLLVPIIGTLCLSTNKIIKDKYMKKFVGIIVFVNLGLVLNSAYNVNTTTSHLIKVNEFLDIYFKVDKLGVLFSLMASILWILTSFYSFEYMSHESKKRMFYAFFVLTLGVTVGISFAGNLFTLYIYYEILTLSTFPLVIHAGTKEALYSGKKYIIYSFSGATLIIFGMMILYSVTGNMNFTHGGIFSNAALSDKNLILISYISMFLGFGVKSALVPFHSWLPAAMVAPTPVSALLHAVAVVKSGIFSLIRITYFVFGATVIKEIGAVKYLIPFAIITILMGSLLALHQDHLKKRLAYSTISQLGYIILGILMLNKNGLSGALLHLINHAFIKITLFFIVGAITHQTGKKYIHQINGLGKNMKITFVCFTIASISLIGIPPTNGFVSKWFLSMGALNNGSIFQVIILLFSAFLTASYLLPIPVAAFFRKSEDQLILEEHLNEDFAHLELERDSKDPNKFMLVPIVILTAIIIFLGLFPNVIISFINDILLEVF
ncbi:complex I subunit 5 family protein [Helicovermis profundi]|uniref:Monovalent cation/H+ antiporter subunit D family protein n=1 Tax=Helicovermis profundi TaxID=3065157 RepID=A0AAU9E978_9FIRM|nr:monovalent cation/H+ antiporter subunit D family protein [Clostridia bacterium S502]